jgi:hypothetical protein
MNKLSLVGCNYLKNIRRISTVKFVVTSCRFSHCIFQVVVSLPTKACVYYQTQIDGSCYNITLTYGSDATIVSLAAALISCHSSPPTRETYPGYQRFCIFRLIPACIYFTRGRKRTSGGTRYKSVFLWYKICTKHMHDWLLIISSHMK